MPSKHFTEDCFEFDLKAQFLVSKKSKRCLKRDAEPAVFSFGLQPKQSRLTREKRAKHRLQEEVSTCIRCVILNANPRHNKSFLMVVCWVFFICFVTVARHFGYVRLSYLELVLFLMMHHHLDDCYTFHLILKSIIMLWNKKRRDCYMLAIKLTWNRSNWFTLIDLLLITPEVHPAASSLV